MTGISPSSTQVQLERYRAQYHQELYDRVLPFWLEHAPDHECGGLFNCLDEDGSVYDTRKNVWLLGRAVWMMSKIHNRQATPGNTSPYLQLARSGADFLRKHARTGDRCYFSLLRNGAPLAMQRKMFSECFYVMALAEYARASGDATADQEARELFAKIQQYARQPALLGRPVYDNGRPPASQLAVPMILLNLIDELNGPSGQAYADVARWCVQQIAKHCRPDLKVVLETVTDDGSLIDDLEGRLLNPGHAIECGWFLLAYAEKTGDVELRTQALHMIEWSLDRGWDHRDGGLFYFLDLGGGSPAPLEWSMKLWWPHNEALVACMMAYRVTRDERWLQRFTRVHDYAFARFPDPVHGEWYGYLDRRGEVTHRFKGGPYKGCFHVPRCLYLVLEEMKKIGIT